MVSVASAAVDLVAVLVRSGLVEVVDDPDRPRRRLVRLTGRGELLAADAREILRRCERSLPASEAVRLRGSLTALGLGAADDVRTPRRALAPEPRAR